MLRLITFLAGLLLASCSVKTETTTTTDSDSTASNTGAQDSSAQVEAADKEEEEEEPDLYAQRAATMAQEVHYLQAEVNFLGFSPDLQYAAYTTAEVGTNDSDFEQNRLSGGFYVMNVDKNTLVADPLLADLGEGEPQQLADTLNKRGIPGLLTKFNISTDNKGNFIPLVYTDDDNDLTINGQKYTLHLVHHLFPDATGFDLSLTKGNASSLLNQDTNVPKSRGDGVERYRMTGVYVNGNKIAVILEYDLPQYQVDGYNYAKRRCLVVTGRISG